MILLLALSDSRRRGAEGGGGSGSSTSSVRQQEEVGLGKGRKDPPVSYSPSQTRVRGGGEWNRHN